MAVIHGLLLIRAMESAPGFILDSIAVVGGGDRSFIALQPAVAPPGLTIQDIGAGCIVQARAVFTANAADIDAAARKLRVRRSDMTAGLPVRWTLTAVRGTAELWRQEGAGPLNGYAPMSFTVPACSEVENVELRGTVEWTEMVSDRIAGSWFVIEQRVPVTRTAARAVRLK